MLKFDTQEESDIFIQSLIPITRPIGNSHKKYFILLFSNNKCNYYFIEDNLTQILEMEQIDEETKQKLIEITLNYVKQELK
jgi:hypothetical protein